MVCYAVPATAAIISTGIWRFRHTTQELFWLNLMLYGGAAFGIIDHLWNNELFLIGPNIANDLLLGFAITAGIFALWAGVVLASRWSASQVLKTPAPNTRPNKGV